MTNTATATETARRLFRNLYAAEATAAQYAELVDLITAASLTSEAARHELARLIDTRDEMERDIEACREEVIARGYTPEQYEAWMDRQVARQA